MAKAKNNGNKPVYLNTICIGAARNWDQVETLLSRFAVGMFGRMFLDGRSDSALTVACEEKLAEAFGAKSLEITDDNGTETTAGFFLVFGDLPEA